MEDGEDIPTETIQSPQVSLMDIGTLRNHLKTLCPLLLDAESDEEVTEFEDSLQQEEVTATLDRFISDTKVPVLLVQKIPAKGLIFEAMTLITFQRTKKLVFLSYWK